MFRSELRAATANPPAGAIYNRTFWLAYLANFVLCTANSLMFRFAELVAYLGGDERSAGAIVGAGLFIACLLRLSLGQGIDRYGTRGAWVISSLVFIVGCMSFLLCRRVSYGLYIARMIYSIGVAGMFTCSVVQVQNMVPLHRRTEAIGVLGTSGFLGLIAGANVGDWIFAIYPPSPARFTALFATAGALGLVYLATIAFLTRQNLHVPPPRHPAALKLLLRYWPGSVVLIAFTLGMGLAVMQVFLTRFATHLNLPRIRPFFTAYAITALIFRVPSTQWAKSIGRHKTILIGLAGNVLGHAMLPFVSKEWHFFFPAIACGFGHAVLYPAIVSLGSGAFPREYRGVATTLVLGFTEFGTAASPPVLGWIIDRYGYPAMFYSASAFGLVVAVYYALLTVRRPDNDNDPEPPAFFGDEELAVVTAAFPNGATSER